MNKYLTNWADFRCGRRHCLIWLLFVSTTWGMLIIVPGIQPSICWMKGEISKHMICNLLDSYLWYYYNCYYYNKIKKGIPFSIYLKCSMHSINIPESIWVLTPTQWINPKKVHFCQHPNTIEYKVNAK